MGTRAKAHASEPSRLTLDAAKVIIDRYRAAVEELVEAKYDWSLTGAHVGRQGKDQEYGARCYLVTRELRRRIEPFRHIEPEWFAKMDEKQYNHFVHRDQRNLHLEKAGRKRVREE